MAGAVAGAFLTKDGEVSRGSLVEDGGAVAMVWMKKKK